MSDSLRQAIDQIPFLDWLEHEGIAYHTAHGGRGEQAILRECPFCGDNRSKVYANAESGLGNCFYCDTKFNKFKFMTKYLNLGREAFRKYVEALASNYGWMPVQRQSSAQSAPVTNSSNVVLPESIPIPIDGRNLQYLEERGIDGATSEHFGLRLCLRGNYEYRVKGETYRQDYSNRIIIPIYDLGGDLASFQGRDITRMSPKKYLFPPGLSATSVMLYNGHNAVGKRHLIVGEGVFDAIAIHMAIEDSPVLSQTSIGAIATFGMHLSDKDGECQLREFAKLRDRGLETVTMMWDAEEKAIKAAIKAANLLRGIGLNARIATLPAGKDPNEVPASVVRDVFHAATTLTATSAVRLLMLSKAR